MWYRFPGCDRQQRLDAHHVKQWIDGGETRMANTLLHFSISARDMHRKERTIYEKS